MRAAVILSTYNAPERLRPTLLGYCVQTLQDFELIVSDDGSTFQTRALIEHIATQFSRPIRHVWQEDIGFRKCRILNQAILSSRADYLIFSDGDCVPRADFVAAHLQQARPGRFLSGGYVKLNEAATARITDECVLTQQALQPDWLIANGMRRTRRLRRLTRSGWRSHLLNMLTPTRPTWNGHNASGWRDDLLHVNGFDERMQYWAQDREFGERLTHAGIRGTQIRHSAICVHLEHGRPYKTARSRERNLGIRRETRHARARWTAHGIIKAPAPPPQPELAPLHDTATDVSITEHLAR